MTERERQRQRYTHTCMHTDRRRGREESEGWRERGRERERGLQEKVDTRQMEICLHIIVQHSYIVFDLCY